MIKIEVILVEGGMVNRGNGRVSTLGEELTKTIKRVQEEKDLDDIDISIVGINFPTVSSGGHAVLVMKYQYEEAATQIPKKKKK